MIIYTKNNVTHTEYRQQCRTEKGKGGGGGKKVERRGRGGGRKKEPCHISSHVHALNNIASYF